MTRRPSIVAVFVGALALAAVISPWAPVLAQDEAEAWSHRYSAAFAQQLALFAEGDASAAVVWAGVEADQPSGRCIDDIGDLVRRELDSRLDAREHALLLAFFDGRVAVAHQDPTYLRPALYERALERRTKAVNDLIDERGGGELATVLDLDLGVGLYGALSENSMVAARDVFDRLARATGDPDALYWLGFVESVVAKPRQAVRAFERLYAEAPGNVEATLRLAVALGRTDRRQEALPIFDAVLAAGGEPWMRRVAYQEAARLDSSGRRLALGLEEFPDDPGLLHLRLAADARRGVRDAGTREALDRLSRAAEEPSPRLRFGEPTTDALHERLLELATQVKASAAPVRGLFEEASSEAWRRRDLPRTCRPPLGAADQNVESSARQRYRRGF
ncbi:MAG: tetratricopeptide repeat protein [Acidobacteriota bacterium]